MNSKAVAYQQLVGIFGCLALVLIAHLRSLPIWVLITVLVCAGIRLLLAQRGRNAPPRLVRLLIAGLTATLLFLQFRTFNGLAAGTALLALMAGLKLLETETQRDIYIITLIIYFLSIAALLDGDSFWLLTYLLAVCWLTTATLLRLTSTPPTPNWHFSLRYAGKMLGQALPLALALWLLFPRFAGPLWSMPIENHGAESGLSDTMSPGDITSLALSDDVAFRVRFLTTAPPPLERYWRGPVMHDFDGHTWKYEQPIKLGTPASQLQGPAYRYILSLEPQQHNWIFALDWPSYWNLPRGVLTSDYTLIQPDPVSHPIDVEATSYTRIEFSAPLKDSARRRDTQLPHNRNPRTIQLAQALRSAHPRDMDYIDAVLNIFAQQAFYYTLTPPKLADDSVDAFLFDTKRGFCGHYASAFATLMRAAGIPAHVVTGYQGGIFNKFSGSWIVQQSNAHAWTEVWIDGHGWTRIDPTAAINPTRVEHSLDATGSYEPAGIHWQHRSVWLTDAWLRLDALRQLWRERILLFDQDSQRQILESLHIPEPDGQKLAATLTVALILAMTWLTWTVRREVDPRRKDLLGRSYLRLCAKLAAIGLPRAVHEGAENYAVRIAECRPDLGPTVIALCRHYSALRYAVTTPLTAAQFNSAVRAFHPRKLPA